MSNRKPVKYDKPMSPGLLAYLEQLRIQTANSLRPLPSVPPTPAPVAPMPVAPVPFQQAPPPQYAPPPTSFVPRPTNPTYY